MQSETKRLVWECLQRGDNAGAVELSRRMLTETPKDPESLTIAAQAEFRVGHFSMGRSLLSLALAVAPQFRPAHDMKMQLDSLDLQSAGADYSQHCMQLRALHIEFPSTLALETVGRCNAHCTFCPHDRLGRKFDEMSDKLFGKIIDELCGFPKYLPLRIFLNIINEPFMDKKIFERMRLLHDAVPHAALELYTNLNVLPPGFFENLKNVRGLTQFNVSLNAANEAEYQATMGIDFARTVANIRRLLTENRTHHFFGFPVLFSRITTMDERDARFKDQCYELFAEFERDREYAIAFRAKGNWLGSIDGPQTAVPYLQPCVQWFGMSVQCNGTVPLCCMDAEGRFAYGDANKHSLVEIYNSPRFRQMRANAATREPYYPCNTCGLY